MTRYQMLLIVLLLFLGGCAMTPEQTTAAVVTASGALVGLVKQWSDAGVLSPEQAAKWTGTAAAIDNTLQATVAMGQMLADGITQVKAAATQSKADASTAETLATVATAALPVAAYAGHRTTMAVRNKSRAKMGQPPA